MKFKLHSEYKPTGDQPQAIEKLVKGINDGKKHQTLLGVTGSGKTFTMANIIEKVNKPTLILAHNKTVVIHHNVFQPSIVLLHQIRPERSFLNQDS